MNGSPRRSDSESLRRERVVELLGEAACVTALVGVTPAEILRDIGVELGARSMTAAQAGQSDVPTVGVAEVPNGVFAIEWNGYQGSRREVLRAVSKSGRVASAFWNINMVMRLSFADDGRVTLLEDGGPVAGDDGGATNVDDVLNDIDLTSGDPRSAMLSTVEKFTGITITADAVMSIARYFPITPVIEDLPSAQPRDERWFTRAAGPRGVDDRVLVGLIVAADPSKQRAFALWVAEQALMTAELIDDPAVVEAVRRCQTGLVGPLPANAAALARQLNAASDRAGVRDSGGSRPETHQAWNRHRAITALRAAAEYPASDDAAVASAASARYVFWENKDQWRQYTHDYFR